MIDQQKAGSISLHNTVQSVYFEVILTLCHVIDHINTYFVILRKIWDLHCPRGDAQKGKGSLRPDDVPKVYGDLQYRGASLAKARTIGGDGTGNTDANTATVSVYYTSFDFLPLRSSFFSFFFFCC